MPDPISYRVCSPKKRASKVGWRRLGSGYDVDKLIRLMETLKRTGSSAEKNLPFFHSFMLKCTSQFAGDELYLLA